MRCIFLALMAVTALAAPSRVAVVVGTGTPGYSDSQVNNPYGLVVGPDGGLYFCDLDNQRVRRLDLHTRQLTTIAGNGERGYRGDGGAAVKASLNMPHELRFDRARRPLRRRARQPRGAEDRHAHAVITTVAGTGTPGFSGDGGPATAAQLRQPHSIAFDTDGALLICDIGNHRIRRVDMRSGIMSRSPGPAKRPRHPTARRLPARRCAARGPSRWRRPAICILRFAKAMRSTGSTPRTRTLHHVAGTGETGYSGDGGPARLATLGGPKGLALARDGSLYVADTENHVIRRIDLKRHHRHRARHRRTRHIVRQRREEGAVVPPARRVRRWRHRLRRRQRIASHPRSPVVSGCRLRGSYRGTAIALARRSAGPSS